VGELGMMYENCHWKRRGGKISNIEKGNVGRKGVNLELTLAYMVCAYYIYDKTICGNGVCKGGGGFGCDLIIGLDGSK
jgi:hypothetical protein